MRTPRVRGRPPRACVARTRRAGRSRYVPPSPPTSDPATRRYSDEVTFARMQATEPGWATRFYGMVLTTDVLSAARDEVIDRSFDDVVDAHLRLNQPHFGGLDKTLS